MTPKPFVTDRYVRLCLGPEFKNPDQRSRAISGRNGSAGMKQKLADLATKQERAHDTKGAADYTLEELDAVTNIEILRDVAKYQYLRAEHWRGMWQDLQTKQPKQSKEKQPKQPKEGGQ